MGQVPGTPERHCLGFPPLAGAASLYAGDASTAQKKFKLLNQTSNEARETIIIRFSSHYSTPLLKDTNAAHQLNL